MTDKNQITLENLKEILRHIRTPEELDNHPWTESLFVREAVAKDAGLKELSPGGQLARTIGRLFSTMMPNTPPRRGLRLDTRWGEFGLLAAYYFAPLSFGVPYPSTLRESWSRIDEVLSLYVYGKLPQELSEEQIARYRLVGDELEFGAASTISDWHRKGLNQLGEVVLAREQYLAASSSEPSIILGSSNIQSSVSNALGEQAEQPDNTHRSYRPRWALVMILLFLVALVIAAGGIKANRVYHSGLAVLEDANRLQELATTYQGFEEIDAAGPLLESLQGDISALKQEVEPFLWLAPGLNWVPAYGCDLAASSDLLDLAESLSESAAKSYQVAAPLLSVLEEDQALNTEELTKMLLQMEPQMASAHEALAQAQRARAAIDADCLSPYMREQLVGKIDPALALLDDGQRAALVLPVMLGATQDGPKTYLLLVQNEDELRSTGGFISSVGNLVIQDGKVISLVFNDSGDQENWSRPYPAAPWQLQEYMNSPVLIFRDVNWFTDFPTTALWAEYLYAYSHSHSVDGVIAFDQHLLVMLLETLGPLEVDGVPYPITAKNVIPFMREAKEHPITPDLYEEGFISQIADAILLKIMDEQELDWRALSRVLLRGLNEKHLLLRFDDPQLTELLARHSWDGAVGRGSGDFLMVVDTNVGFNKTNAVVETALSYDVDLTDLSAPQSTLTVFHTNNGQENIPCIHWDDTGSLPDGNNYPIDRCYWNYLRVYTREGTILLDAAPHTIPADWMIGERAVPARVDVLEEEILNVQAFGSLLVVPGGQTLSTSFHFELPGLVVSKGTGTQPSIYRLKVQKQPGTLAIPLTVRIHLPLHTSLINVSMASVREADNMLFETDLRRDVEIELVFSSP